jgi:hypothetical protein
MVNICIDKIRDAFAANNIFIGRSLFIEHLIESEDGNNDASINAITKIIDSHRNLYKMDKIILFHGTSKKNNIKDEGILKTTARRKRSLQSRVGRVSLSLYPSTAQLFGELAYPGEEIEVYAVCVPFRDLIADTDQLANKRAALTEYGDSSKHIKNTLPHSFFYGSGAWLKRHVHNYEVRPLHLFVPNRELT